MKYFTLLLAIFFYSSSVVHLQGRETDLVFLQIMSNLKVLSRDPVLVQAVLEQNALKMTLEEIKSTDHVWRNSYHTSDFMNDLMSNKAADRLFEIEESDYRLFELILMDNQGANVAVTNQTSDYWQGDEDKFQLVYPMGTEAHHISKVEFDNSTQARTVQISIPIIYQEKNIGALTIGVMYDELG